LGDDRQIRRGAGVVSTAARPSESHPGGGEAQGQGKGRGKEAQISAELRRLEQHLYALHFHGEHNRRNTLAEHNRRNMADLYFYGDDSEYRSDDYIAPPWKCNSLGYWIFFSQP